MLSRGGSPRLPCAPILPAAEDRVNECCVRHAAPVLPKNLIRGKGACLDRWVLKIQYTRNEHPIKENTPDIHNKVACARSRSNILAGRFWMYVSSGTRVPMMQAADLRDGNNLAFRRRLDAPRRR